MKQIQGLAHYLNVKNNFNADQIAETAELVVHEFTDLSLTAIADCFNQIKLHKPPFNRDLYSSLDGSKVCDALYAYRDLQAQHREHEHNQTKHSDPLPIAAGGTADEVQRWCARVREAIDVQSITVKQIVEHSPWDAKVKGWINDFHEEKKRRREKEEYGEIDAYLEKRLAEYNQIQADEERKAQRKNSQPK